MSLKKYLEKVRSIDRLICTKST